MIRVSQATQVARAQAKADYEQAVREWQKSLDHKVVMSMAEDFRRGIARDLATADAFEEYCARIEDGTLPGNRPRRCDKHRGGRTRLNRASCHACWELNRDSVSS